ncbi:Crp/Fnr family transcriptional regulator [Paenibacillus thermotolerans]|uniref:Crp/Fnr family transcriptional regulator n=1 Tax=Paenibacillus thermotolerans TaxID=3027807 RepID=UPI002368551B|nr:MULTISPECIES: Crp/Fnr family transcriptional regulator [unclassified Paenibacillus]
MREIKDRDLLGRYLRDFQIESIFNESLYPYLSLYSFNPGESVCSQGERAETLFVLVKGKIKIFTSSPEGKTLILSFKTPLEAIGDLEYVQDIDFINTVEAVTHVVMVGIPYRWLRKFGSDYAPLLNFLLDIITRKFYVKSNSMSFNLMYPVEVRAASYLLSVSYDQSDDQFKGRLETVHLKDAANLIGTSYRHLNRVLKRFSNEGLVERQRGFILVKDKEGLSALASRNIYE